jgi:hypothetical protein
MDIPNDIFGCYEEGVEALLNSPYIGREAKLYYETKQKCICEGICSDCNGVNKVILLDTITIRIYNSTKQWLQTGGIQFIDGRCQILGRMKDADTLSRCTYILAEGKKFKLITHPMRHGFGSNYFIAYMDLYEDTRI